jgi:flagellar biosynthesis GTPase FlhF
MGWGAAVGAIASGVLGNMGQSSANKTNVNLNAQNRRFQERMSSTAYQRSAKDLEKAGLNRILALGGPSSSPQGSVAKVENTMESAAASAKEVMMQAAQIQQIKQQAKKLKQDTETSKQQAALMQSQRFKTGS